MWFLFVLATAVRFIVACRTHVIAKDGATVFISMAQQMAAGNWRAVVLHPHHPLFSLGIYGAYLAVGNWLVAAQATGILVGALAIFPLFGLVRPVFGQAAAVAAGLVFAFHTPSARSAADVISEPLFMLCVLSAGCCGLRAWRKAHPGWGALAGLAAGLAYLTRPEGLGTFLVVGSWMLAATAADLIRKPSTEKRWRTLLKRLPGLLLTPAVCALVAAPYVLATHRETGEWTLARKRDRAAMVTHGDQPESGHRQELLSHPSGSGGTPAPPTTAACRARWRRPLFDLVALFCDYGRVLGVSGVLLLVGLLARRRFVRDKAGELFLASLFAAYFLLHGAAVCVLHYFGERHALQGVTFLLPWIGVGGVTLWRAARQPAGKRLALAARVVLAVVVVVLCVQTVKERRVDRRGERVVGLWIRRHALGRPKLLRLAGTRTAVYADAVEHPPPWPKEGGQWVATHPFAELMAWVRESKPDYVLIHKHVESLIPDFFAASKEANWEPVFRCSERGEPTEGPSTAWWLFEFHWSGGSEREPGALNERRKAT